MDVGDEASFEGIIETRCCACYSKNDHPKNSFESIGNYFRALMEIPWRLADRISSRSADQMELVEVKARSQHDMKKTLTWWDLMWFGMGAVIGSGIFVLTGLETRIHAGPAVVLSFVVSGISALLSVFCYTEFAVEIPVAGKTLSIYIYIYWHFSSSKLMLKQ
jgi:APA family basic amino acid/polyamine antiporter